MNEWQAVHFELEGVSTLILLSWSMAADQFHLLAGVWHQVTNPMDLVHCVQEAVCQELTSVNSCRRLMRHVFLVLQVA
eukprot:4658650-Amphidinium_carterae.2